MASFKIDFTGVEEGGGKLLPAGEYICKVTNIEVKDGAKAKYLKWTFTVGIGEHKNKKIFHNTSFAKNALFNLRNTIMALGIDVPKSAFSIDLDSYKGKVLGVKIIESTYTKNGQEKPTIEIEEMFRVAKTDAGWGRKDAKEEVSLDSVSSIEEPEEEIEI